jgi:hypothetical protein
VVGKDGFDNSVHKGRMEAEKKLCDAKTDAKTAGDSSLAEYRDMLRIECEIWKGAEELLPDLGECFQDAIKLRRTIGLDAEDRDRATEALVVS